ncbi:helix-turn-helix transcriptional regulator [Streptomyces roseirectus]|uniref:Helix-turn-helix transcriptional regulator n=1 Tax=Streptomyces roseirectus TaxID=2768066 RepID=A0A7H0ING2_9ACTN|nr:TetR/AcrR family transcriptional regulator [Streptomyces roseirectus]QNP74328.1 helix-turn-helix transcriptional regulator [Streptomyces roseirectus]
MSALLPPFVNPSDDTPTEPELLQLDNPADEPCLRADAARNRARLLDAAAKLVARHGAAGVTMEAVAVEANVGKGTVFRRFGDRTGLLTALLDHSAHTFQAAFLSGPPPLGPGAPPVERLHAFGRALLRASLDHLDLQLAAEAPAERRYAVGAGRFLHTHVTLLLRQSVPDADHELLAHALMGYLSPAFIHHMVRQCGQPLERLEAGWDDLVDRVTRTAPAPV